MNLLDEISNVIAPNTPFDSSHQHTFKTGDKVTSTSKGHTHKIQWDADDPPYPIVLPAMNHKHAAMEVKPGKYRA